MLDARKAVQQGFIALEVPLRGILRNFNARGRFEQRIRELAAGNVMSETATEQCFLGGQPCDRSWQDWSAVSASSPKMIRRAAG